MTLHLYASVLTLVARNEADVPISHGQYARAAFYNLIEQTDADLATWLHDKNTRKEFTVSPLMRAPEPRNKVIHLRPGDSCQLRFTLIGRRLFVATSQGFLTAGVLPQIQIGQACFDIAEVRTTTGSHHWAGAQSLDELVRRSVDAATPVIRLQFRTPTRFNIKVDELQRAHLLPSPEWVFGSLIHKWQEIGCDEVLDLSSLINELMPLPADGPNLSELAGWRNLIAKRVLVQEVHNVHTRMMRLYNIPHAGFEGEVSYEIIGEPHLVQAMNVLANAAIYFGVGSDTTMGMGQCRRIVDF